MEKRKTKFDCDPACPDFAGIRVVGETKSLKSVFPPCPQGGRILRNCRRSILSSRKDPSLDGRGGGGCPLSLTLSRKGGGN